MRSIVWLIVIRVVVFVVGGIIRDNRLGSSYQLVRPGMSIAQATAIMGPPSWRGACNSGELGQVLPGCRSELGYRSWFAPVKPVYWLVQFDDAKRVISSDYVPSP